VEQMGIKGFPPNETDVEHEMMQAPTRTQNLFNLQIFPIQSADIFTYSICRSFLFNLQIFLPNQSADLFAYSICRSFCLFNLQIFRRSTMCGSNPKTLNPKPYTPHPTPHTPHPTP